MQNTHAPDHLWVPGPRWPASSFVCPSVCLSGDFAIFAFTNVTWDTETGFVFWVHMLTEETKSVHFGTLQFDHLPRSAVVTFYQLFSKTAKSPRVVSGGKTRKSEQMDPFPQCKNVQKYIFLETRTLDLR